MTTAEIVSIAVSAVVTVITGIIVFVLKGYISDMKKYRAEREKKEQAKDDLVLGLARVSLLENYYKCERQGFYSTKDREVFGKLFEAYKTCGGDGVIDQIAPKIRALPTSLHGHQGDEV